MAREYSSPQRKDQDYDHLPIPDPAPAAATSSKQSQSADLDSLLDEIDGVLETNAEEFVKGFVQKGGQ